MLRKYSRISQRPTRDKFHPASCSLFLAAAHSWAAADFGHSHLRPAAVRMPVFLFQAVNLGES